MSNKPKILLTDLDGVYIDWFSGFVSYMKSIGYTATAGVPTIYNMTDIFPMLKKPWEHIKDFQQSQFYAELKPYEDAKKVYKELYDAGVQIFAITSCGTESETVRMRRDFIDAQGIFTDAMMLGLGESKLDALRHFNTGVFIDDLPAMVVDGTKAGHTSLLKTMPYNLDACVLDEKRIGDFSELKQIFGL